MFLKYLQNNFGQELLRIFPLIPSPLRVRSFWVFVLMVMHSLLELFFILSLHDMGIALTNPDGLRASFLYAWIFHFFPNLYAMTLDPRHLLLLVGVVVVLVNIIKNIVSFYTSLAIAYLGEDISLNVGNEIMSRFLYQDYAWHLSPESTSMYQSMLWRGQLGAMLTQLLTLYATILTTIILFFSLMGSEPILTSLVVGLTSAIGYILFHTLRSNVDSSAHLSSLSAQAENKALLCASKGIREVLIYRQQETFLEALMSAARAGRSHRTFTSIAPTLPTWVLEAVGFFVVILAMAFLIFVENADIPRISAALGLLVLTAWRLLPYCNRVVSLQISIRGTRPMAHAVIDLLEKLRSLPSKPHPIPEKDFTFTNEISLENICFRYSGASADSLKNINFTVRKGEKIGLIGASGGGKTTLAGVLSGLLPPTHGNILIDGITLDSSKRAALAEQIGYVPQSPFLFAGTLAENVAFKDWGKEWDEEKVYKACKQASIDFVQDHKKGILRPIGENGAGLSGGQAQRVSIARAMYTDPSLLIFDEATSALDQHNEHAIQETIENLADKVTCVIIAHRLSTVAHCDRVLWIDKGTIIMDGPAKEVVEKYQAVLDTSALAK